MKLKFSIALVGLLFPLLGAACGLKCERQFAQLVAYRAEAITAAFGDLYGTLPNDIPVKLISRKDPAYERFKAGVAFDPDTRTLNFPHEFVLMRLPEWHHDVTSYWPYYQDAYVRRQFPVVEAIDNILWGIYLQGAARASGLSWPHEDCQSVDIGERLACEMLTGGIAESVKNRPMPMFNTNLMDRILPSDFAAFRRRVLRTDTAYREVQRYGGILLIEPLITEFGVSRTLAYVAQTPFHIEQDDLQGSVLRYQKQARKALVPAPTIGARLP